METEGSFLRRSFELNLIWRFEASHTRTQSKIDFEFSDIKPVHKVQVT